METPAASATMATSTAGPFPPPVVGIVPGRTEDCDTPAGAVVGDVGVDGPSRALVGVVGPVDVGSLGMVGPVWAWSDPSSLWSAGWRSRSCW